MKEEEEEEEENDLFVNFDTRISRGSAFVLCVCCKAITHVTYVIFGAACFSVSLSIGLSVSLFVLLSPSASLSVCLSICLCLFVIRLLFYLRTPSSFCSFSYFVSFFSSIHFACLSLAFFFAITFFQSIFPIISVF